MITGIRWLWLNFILDTGKILLDSKFNFLFKINTRDNLFDFALLFSFQPIHCSFSQQVLNFMDFPAESKPFYIFRLLIFLLKLLVIQAISSLI